MQPKSEPSPKIADALQDKLFIQQASGSQEEDSLEEDEKCVYLANIEQ